MNLDDLMALADEYANRVGIYRRLYGRLSPETIAARAALETALREALKDAEPIDHVECPDCGRYFRCDCGCRKPEIHYASTGDKP